MSEHEALPEKAVAWFSWGEAWTIVRSNFRDMHEFLYALVWSRFAWREAVCEMMGELSIDNGTEPTSSPAAEKVLWVKVDVESRKSFFHTRVRPLKVNKVVRLSRTDPKVDAWKHNLKIVAVKSDHVLFSDTSVFPVDGNLGVWRLDVAMYEVALCQQLSCITNFAQDASGPFYDVVVRGSLVRADNPVMATSVSVPSVPQNCDMSAIAAVHGLNEQQLLALFLSFQERLILVQGPPGTGKTRTAAALISAHKLHSPRLLVTSAGNQAVNNLCKSLYPYFGDNLVRYVSADAEESGMADLPEMQKIIYPHAIKQMLHQLGYDPSAKGFPKHVKKYGGQMLEERQVVCATCHCAASASSPLSNMKYDFLVVDEAAQATEPTVIMPLTLSSQHARAVMVGDHKQVPATVKDSGNVDENNGISLFQRLVEDDFVEYVISGDIGTSISFKLTPPVLAEFPTGRPLPDEVATGHLASCPQRA